MIYEQFLNPQQLVAMGKVRRLLYKLEKVEGLYPNCQKMGDAHPQYRTLSFQRKVDTLTLWLKVMDGLSKTLSSMSSWLGVPIILPELCREYSQSLSYRSKTSSCSEQEVKEDGGIMFTVESSRKGSIQQEYISYRSVYLKRLARGPYRNFIDRSLKRNSVSTVMTSIQKFIRPIQELAITALSTDKGPEQDESVEESMRKCLLPESNSLRWLSFKRASSDGYLNWSQEFEFLNLPHFGKQYVQLMHIPLDVMHECLKQQLELNLPKKILPDATELPINITEVSSCEHVPLSSQIHELGLHCFLLPCILSPLPPHTFPSSLLPCFLLLIFPSRLIQLVSDCRECLQEAIKARDQYRKCMEVIILGDQNMTDQVDTDIKYFQNDLNEVLVVRRER